MADGFSTYNTTIEFVKMETGSVISGDFATEITGFEESAIERQVTYTKTIGGLILPKKETATEKTVTFNFIVTDAKFEQFISDVSADSVEDWDTFNKYKITLGFTDGTNNLLRVYYDAVITIATVMPEDDVLMGNITFSLPLKNILGNTTFYVFEDIGDKTKHDSVMGYA